MLISFASTSTLDDVAVIVAAVGSVVAAYFGNANRRHLGDVKQVINGTTTELVQHNTALSDALVHAGVEPPPPTPAAAEAETNPPAKPG